MTVNVVLDSIAKNTALRLTTVEVVIPKGLCNLLLCVSPIKVSPSTAAYKDNTKDAFLFTSSCWSTIVHAMLTSKSMDFRNLGHAIDESLFKSSPNKIDPFVAHAPFIAEDDVDFALEQAVNHIPESNVTVDNVEKVARFLILKVSAVRSLNHNYHDWRTFENTATLADRKKRFQFNLDAFDWCFSDHPLNAVYMDHQYIADDIKFDPRSAEPLWFNQHLHGIFTGWISNRNLQVHDQWKKREVKYG